MVNLYEIFYKVFGEPSYKNESVVLYVLDQSACGLITTSLSVDELISSNLNDKMIVSLTSNDIISIYWYGKSHSLFKLENTKIHQADFVSSNHKDDNEKDVFEVYIGLKSKEFKNKLLKIRVKPHLSVRFKNIEIDKRQYSASPWKAPR